MQTNHLYNKYIDAYITITVVKMILGNFTFFDCVNRGVALLFSHFCYFSLNKYCSHFSGAGCLDGITI